MIYLPPEIQKAIEKEARKYASLEEYPNTVWQRQGYKTGAILWASRCAELLEALKRIHRRSESKMTQSLTDIHEDARFHITRFEEATRDPAE